jgi:hypothetical protein
MDETPAGDAEKTGMFAGDKGHAQRGVATYRRNRGHLLTFRHKKARFVTAALSRARHVLSQLSSREARLNPTSLWLAEAARFREYKIWAPSIQLQSVQGEEPAARRALLFSSAAGRRYFKDAPTGAGAAPSSIAA